MCLFAAQREQIGVFGICFITLFQETKQHRVEVPCVSPQVTHPFLTREVTAAQRAVP